MCSNIEKSNIAIATYWKTNNLIVLTKNIYQSNKPLYIMKRLTFKLSVNSFDLPCHMTLLALCLDLQCHMTLLDLYLDLPCHMILLLPCNMTLLTLCLDLPCHMTLLTLYLDLPCHMILLTLCLNLPCFTISELCVLTYPVI